MHSFNELVYRSTAFTLNAVEKENNKVIEELEKSGSTSAIKSLQMFQLQKVILAVGMFSIFDAMLQDSLSTNNGFKKAKEILLKKEIVLHDRFQVFIAAINVLKHGRGVSYDFLVNKSNALPFNIKLPGQSFFFEGDVSEISTLIEVDDKFVLDCAELIEHVSGVIKTI